jgi:hypothetical protein
MPRYLYMVDELTWNFAGKGQQSQLAGAFHGVRNFSLVLCASACLTSRTDFTIIANVTAKQLNRFVIDQDTFIGAELAHTGLSVKPFSAVLGFIRRIFVRHCITPIAYTGYGEDSRIL